MKFINFCDEPLFFMKIYNSISDDKRYEFEQKFKEFEDLFEEHYDHKLFNPKISFKDSFIVIEQDKTLISRIDLREELNDKIIIPESLLEEILHELNVCHGLYVCDVPEKVENDLIFKIDHNDICDSIEKVLN